MDFFKIIVAAITGTMLAIVLKEQKPFLGVALSCVCALYIFFLGLPYLDRATTFVRVFYSSIGESGYMSSLLKITGIAILSTFASNICSDAGMSAVSSAVNFVGKIICMCMTLPIISDFFKELITILP